MYRSSIAALLAVLFTLTAHSASDGDIEPAEPAIVSLVPAVTEILFALGVQNQLRAVTTFCDYPEEARALPKVGDFSNPSIERIVGMKPDLVFATIPEQRGTVEHLRRLGVRTEIINPESIDEILSAIVQIGEWTDASARAHKIVEEMSAERASLQGRIAERGRRLRVYVELDVNPLFTVGRGSFVNRLVELAGGQNIVDSEMPYIAINAEIVVARDPEVIVLTYPGAATDVSSRAGWGTVSAVVEGRIIDDVDPNLLTRPGPRCIKGAVELFERFYPDVE
jgi:iron complex transport system substrate-binding protein